MHERPRFFTVSSVRQSPEFHSLTPKRTLRSQDKRTSESPRPSEPLASCIPCAALLVLLFLAATCLLDAPMAQPTSVAADIVIGLDIAALCLCPPSVLSLPFSFHPITSPNFFHYVRPCWGLPTISYRTRPPRPSSFEDILSIVHPFQCSAHADWLHARPLCSDATWNLLRNATSCTTTQIFQRHVADGPRSHII
ncbi:hypothetical protein DFH06DRAFT_216078 [Mycena polygramma]|nr:hypothetical protein DFH06DRAFT_216078 [Mycena polygramma]